MTPRFGGLEQGSEGALKLRMIFYIFKGLFKKNKEERVTEKGCGLQSLKYFLFSPLRKELPYLWPSL